MNQKLSSGKIKDFRREKSRGRRDEDDRIRKEESNYQRRSVDRSLPPTLHGRPKDLGLGLGEKSRSRSRDGRPHGSSLIFRRQERGKFSGGPSKRSTPDSSPSRMSQTGDTVKIQSNPIPSNGSSNSTSFQTYGGPDGNLLVEDSRLARILQRLEREDDRERQLSSLRQLKEIFSACENSKAVSHNLGTIINTFDELIHHRLHHSVKQEIVSCLGMIGTLLGSEARSFFQWIFNTCNSTISDEYRILLVKTLHENLKEDKSSGGLENLMPMIMTNTQSTLENADLPDLLVAVVDVIIDIAKTFPSIFRSHFRDTVDILVGWHIDSTQAYSLTRYTSEALISFQQFWVEDINFSVTLLGQFLEDMEAYAEDLVQGNTITGGGGDGTLEDQPPSSAECLAKITSLIRVFTTVLKSLGKSVSPNESIAVTWDFLTENLKSLLRSVMLTTEYTYQELLITAANESIMLLLLNTQSHAVVAMDKLLLFFKVFQLQSVEKLSEVHLLSILQLLIQCVNVLNTQLTVAFVKFVFSPDSLCYKLKFYPSKNIQSQLLALQHMVLRLKNVPVLEEAYKYILGDIEAAFSLLMEKECKLTSSQSNIGCTFSYNSKKAAGISFVSSLCALAEIGNAKHSIIGMWALNPGFFDLIVTHLQPSSTHLAKEHPAIQYSMLHVLYSHCTRHGHFVSSSLLVSPGPSSVPPIASHSSPILATMSVVPPPSSGHLCSILTLLSLLLEQKETSCDTRLLCLCWVQEVVEGIQHHLSRVVENRDFTRLVNAVINLGYSLDPNISVSCCIPLQTIIRAGATLYKKYLFKRCFELCLLKINDVDENVRREFLSLLVLLPLDIVISSPVNTAKFGIHQHSYLEVTPSQLWQVRRGHMNHFCGGTFHSHNFKTVMGFILHGAHPKDKDWPVRLFQSCQRSDKSSRKLMKLAISYSPALWFWATWESALACVTNKLRTPLGKPQDTFTTIEAAIKSYAKESSRFPHSPKSLAKENKLIDLKRVKLLLDFMEHLEKLMYNAYEGCAIALPTLPKAVRTFFRTNKGTCQEWLHRVRLSVLVVAQQCGQPAVVIRQGYELLSEMKETENTQNGDFERTLVLVVQALMILRCPEPILGLYTWTKEKLGKKYLWIKTAVDYAAGRYETAVQGFNNLYQTMNTDYTFHISNCKLSTLGEVSEKFENDKYLSNETSESTNGTVGDLPEELEKDRLTSCKDGGIYGDDEDFMTAALQHLQYKGGPVVRKDSGYFLQSFLLCVITECYKNLGNWAEVEKWIGAQKQINNKNGLTFPQFFSDEDIDYIKTLSVFEGGLGASSSSSDKSLKDFFNGDQMDLTFLGWNIEQQFHKAEKILLNSSLEVDKNETLEMHQVSYVVIKYGRERISTRVKESKDLLVGLLQASAMDWPPYIYPSQAALHVSAAAFSSLLQDGRKISPALLSVDHSLNPADVSTAVLTYSLSWTNVWNHVATKQQGIKPQMSCVSGLQLAAARLARKQQNYKLAQDLLLKSIKLITGTESDVLNGPGGNKSLLQVLKNLCNFPVSEQLLEVQREGAKLLQSGGNSEDGIGILLGSTRSSVTILNNKELVLKDTSLSFLRELTTRSILTLVKYLRQDAALLTQLSSCQNENLEKDVENFNWLLETSAQSPSTVSCLTDSLRRSLSDFSGLHFQADYTVGPTDCALGQLLHLGVNQCPMSAKAWSLLAGWCYRWGRKAVDTSSSTNSLYPEEAEKALSILPQDIDSETKEAVLQVLRQIHRSTCEDWDDDHPGWDLLEDMAEMTKKQLTSICPQLTSSKIFLEHLVAIRKGVVQRAYCYYELTAKAYFQFLHLSDQSNLEKENVTATLRLLRLVVKHASELRDVLEKGLAKTPTAPWRGIIPQLFSRLSHPEPYVRQSISDLLCRVAQASPHLIVFPAVVGCLTSKARVNLQQDTSCDFFEPYLSQGLAAETGSHDLVTLPDNQDLPKSIPGVVSDEEDSEEDSQNTAIMQNCFSALVETLGRQDARTIAEVKTLVHELRRITLLWDELWLGTLTLHHSEMCRRVSILEEEIKKVEGNSSLSKQDKLQIIKEKHHVFLKTVLFVLQQLQQITSQPPETPHEQWFQNTFNEVIETTLEKLQNPSNPYQPHQSLQYYKQLHQMLQQKVQQQSRGHLMMDKISPVLADLKSTVIPMPGINATSSSIVTIQSFFQNVSILPTKTKPKKLAFVGSDGQKYTYLFKGLEDLHLDERIMQFLSIVNNMFMKKKRNGNVIYKARHYSVTPLGPRSGLIQWVDGATALFGLYKRWQQREAVAQVLKNQAAGVSIVPSTILRPSEVFYNKLNPILKEKGISVDSRKEWPLSILLHVLKDLMCETPRDLLTKELWCSCSSALEWWEVTQTYSHSTAVMSMIGYIIGLGDRHLDNVLVDLATGEVVHIDYNVCFEKGKNLRVPEKVPFRMTPNIETALGITGVEGTFRASCEYVLNVLRKERETLLTLLEAFVYDPLIDWTPGNEGGYTGAVYGGGQSVVTDTRQTKQEMEREIAFSMFAIRVAEMKGDWLKNKDDLAASLPKLNKFLLAWLEAQTELQAAETELQETCHKRALLEEARIDSSHSLHSLPKRYEEYAVVKNTVQSAKDAVQDKLDDCKKWHNHHISGLQSLCGPELGQWYIEIAKLEPQTESVPEVHVAGFLQSAGQGQLVQQCEHAEFELNNLLEQQRLTLGTCLELLSRYATIIMQFSPSYKKENRNFQWQEWLESLLNTFTLSNCQVVINKFHNKYGAESIDVELVQAAVTTYVQMQSEVTNLKTKVVNLLERRHLEGVEDLPSITAAVKDAKAHLAQFIEENGEEGQFSLMGVMVKALSALTKRLVMMEGAAAAAGEHLVDLVSWGGDWFLDEIHSVGNNVAQVISVLQENCKNIQPQVKAAFSTVTSALNVFTALEDLSFNFQTIILPEAMKCIQSKEPSVLEMVEKLEMLLKGPSLTVTELTVKLESHLRNLIMEIEDDQSSVVTTVNLMRRNFDNLMRGAEPEISELTPGQMLLMGFSGLFSKLEADMADFLLSLDQLAPSPSWRKLDVMRDAATLTPPVYSASTRSVLNHIFFLRRLQTMQEFFQQCHQNAASLQLSDRRVGLPAAVRRSYLSTY
ncbi:serine/threonine-protein kinase Smg1 isoform X2 [Tachypleus tridentatus]|uniref:serine/threonine-protein kinase Smg1 isoform X2 n=1 Tax=Tachypleus tridentatus TaxID=6853 RepID=UPI003FCFE4B3